MLKLYVAIQNKLAMARNEEGQTMAEYGVVLAVITIGVVGAIGLLSGAIGEALGRVEGMLDGNP
jgi:Flp pilus assembly pilin Flp